jgi:N-methylhydantoinase B
VSTTTPRRVDPIELEVFHQLFAAIAEEMGACLARAAVSPNIKERLDLSCALFSGAGELLGQAAHIPVHLGSAAESVRAAAAAFELEPGDAVLLNDPYAGGTHLPDLTLVTPVFAGGERPRLFVANRAHHADIGGAQPGSIGIASDLFGEGLVIPPVRLLRRGVIDGSVESLILANVRTPSERRADLQAQVAANELGVRRLEELIAAPRLFTDATCAPAILTNADVISRPEVDSAFFTERVIACEAAVRSTMIPLRIPSDGSMPTPRMRRDKSSSTRPTRVHILVVPTSMPTMISSMITDSSCNTVRSGTSH